MIGRLADDADLRRRLKDELEVLAHVPLGEIAHLSGEGARRAPPQSLAQHLCRL